MKYILKEKEVKKKQREERQQIYSDQDKYSEEMKKKRITK